MGNSSAVSYATNHKPTLKPTTETLVQKHLENNAHSHRFPKYRKTEASQESTTDEYMSCVIL